MILKESFFQVVSSFVDSTVAVLVVLDEELPLEVVVVVLTFLTRLHSAVT